MPENRVVVVVNKWWECDPVLNALLHEEARPKDTYPWPHPLNHPHPRHGEHTPAPRAVFALARCKVELWCVSDLLEDLPDQPQYQSSSQRKAERLSQILQAPSAHLVIAVGTAGFPSLTSENGSVVIGTRVFMHDCHPNGSNKDSQWRYDGFENIIPSSLPREAFDTALSFDANEESEVLHRFVLPPLNPAARGSVLADYNFVALGAVNVTDYGEYDRTDRQTLAAFQAVGDMCFAKSLETTHGMIRAYCRNAPFLFMSGITDRVGYFDAEVKPRTYAQNFAAAHNAGVALAWLLPRVDRWLGVVPGPG